MNDDFRYLLGQYVPEFILPQDGTEKQDCEMNAAKRWVEQEHETLRRYRAILLGDDLYSKEPLCETVLESGYDFIFVCHRESHPALYGPILTRNKWVTSLLLDETLSTTLLTLNLLAFLLHTIAQVADKVYQQVRCALGTRRTFFNDTEALIRYLLFPDWHAALRFMFVELELPEAYFELLDFC